MSFTKHIKRPGVLSNETDREKPVWHQSRVLGAFRDAGFRPRCEDNKFGHPRPRLPAQMQLPSFVKDSSFKVGSASKILAGRNIGQQDLGRAQHRAASKHRSISQTTPGKESCLCGRKWFETPWPLRPIVGQQSGTRRLLKMPQGRIFADLPMEN